MLCSGGYYARRFHKRRITGYRQVGPEGRRKGHTLVEYAGRGLSFPDDSTEPPSEGSYVGTYKLNPDGSWTGAGTGTETFKGGDTITYTWEEGSDLKEYTYKYTDGCTGKYKGASGGGT